MKLNLKTKFSYGLAGIGDATVYNLIGNFLLFFLSTIVGINPAVAGTIAAVGAVWETACGAFVGYISDNTYSRFGRRKPFLLIAAFPLAVFTSLLFTAIDASEGLRVAYYTVMLILFWTSFAVFFVPYLAWGAELTQDYHERTVLRGYAFFFNTLGMATGIVLPTVFVDTLMRWGSSAPQGWQYTGIFCGVLSGVTILFGALGIKDKYELTYSANKPKKKPKERRSSIKRVLSAIGNMVQNYREILRLRCVKFIVAASIFYLMGYAVFCADRMYFFTYNMKLPAGQITLILSLMTFASVAFLPAITAANKRFGKRYTFIAGMGVCILVMAGFGLIGFTSVGAVCIFAVAYCIGSICYWQLMPAMIYDVCEVDQLVHQKERAGLVISLQSLAESLANAAGLQLLGLILQFAGFNGEAKAQAAETLTWTGWSFSIIPAVFMALAVVMIIKYPVTKEMYRKVLDALQRREKGEKIDMEPFKTLI